MTLVDVAIVSLLAVALEAANRRPPVATTESTN